MLEMTWQERNPYSLLMLLQVKTATMEISL